MTRTLGPKLTIILSIPKKPKARRRRTQKKKTRRPKQGTQFPEEEKGSKKNRKGPKTDGRLYRFAETAY